MPKTYAFLHIWHGYKSVKAGHYRLVRKNFISDLFNYKLATVLGRGDIHILLCNIPFLIFVPTMPLHLFSYYSHLERYVTLSLIIAVLNLSTD